MQRDEHRAAVAPGNGETHLRASDHERERVVDLLAQHAADGRLMPEELDARIDRVHAARTRGELAVLTSDLPASERSDHRGRTRSRAAQRLRPDLPRQLVAFVLVNLVLVAVWGLSGGGYFWPVWPILGWGLALARPGSCRRRPAHTRGWRSAV